MENIFQYLAEILQAVGESPTALTALMFVLLAVLASLLFKQSRGLSGICAFIALLAFAFFVVVTFNKAPSPASQNQTTNPLQVGTYRSDNYFLNIFQEGERICLRATSKHASNVVSVHVDPNNSKLYQAHQYPDWSFTQVDPTTVSFGGRDYVKEGRGFPKNIPDLEQECLSSTGNFFKHIPANLLDRGTN